MKYLKGPAAKWAVFAFFLLTFIHGAYYLQKNHQEDTFLEEKFTSKIHSNDEKEILRSMLQMSFNIPTHKDRENPPQYHLVNPLLKILGPSPKLIAENGGHCGRRSRLLIALLDQKGIMARKVNLINYDFQKYWHKNEYVHAVVEANINGVWVVADPLYNLVYLDELGNMVGLEKIQNTQDIFNVNLMRAELKYVEYHKDLYTYDEYRMFNWSDLPFGRATYNFLSGIFGNKKMNMVQTPIIIEKPYWCLTVMSFLGSVCSLLLIGRIVFKEKRNCHKRHTEYPNKI